MGIRGCSREHGDTHATFYLSRVGLDAYLQNAYRSPALEKVSNYSRLRSAGGLAEFVPSSRRHRYEILCICIGFVGGYLLYGLLLRGTFVLARFGWQLLFAHGLYGSGGLHGAGELCRRGANTAGLRRSGGGGRAHCGGTDSSRAPSDLSATDHGRRTDHVPTAELFAMLLPSAADELPAGLLRAELCDGVFRIALVSATKRSKSRKCRQ